MAPEIILYGHRISPFVEKVLRALELKGLRYRQDVPSRAALKGMGPGPRKIPVLRIGETWTYDSTFILRELDRVRPEPPLFSADPIVATEQRLLESVATGALRFAGPSQAASRRPPDRWSGSRRRGSRTRRR